MNASPPDRTVPFNIGHVFRRGMGRRILLYILAVALPPLILAGGINYQAACGHMEQEIQRTVRIIADLKSQQIRAYLHRRLADAERKGHEPATISFFKALMRCKAASGETLPGIDLGAPGNSAISAHDCDTQLHAELHGYGDILMIDRKGNVVFPSAKPLPPIGNLKQAQMAGIGISAAFRETINTGNPVFSGFEPDVSEDNGVRAFITAAIGGPGEPPVGVIVFELLGSDIEQRLNQRPEPGPNMRIYLIDADLTLLAGTASEQRPGTRLTLTTEIAQRWREAALNGKPPLPPSGLIRYRDPGGHQIVGTCVPIQAGRSPCALVAEMDRSMAYAPIHRQQTIFLAIVILTAAGTLVVTVILTRMLIEPVRNLTDQMTMAAQGQRDHVAPVCASHELDELATACNDLTDHTRALTTEHETLSRFVAGMASLHRLLGGAKESGDLYFNTLEFLSDFLDLDQADFYIRNEKGQLQCAWHFPDQPACESDMVFYLGEGRVGQAALEQTLLAYRKRPAEELTVRVPSVDLGNVLAMPLTLQEITIGGLEVEKKGGFSLFDGHFLKGAAAFIAIALEAAMSREKEIFLLKKTQEQAEQLKRHETVLDTKTRELKAQSHAFQKSEQVLQLKHLELEAANAQMAKNAADLEANMAILEKQKRNMQKQNAELEKAHRELADKARQLEISSQYKTEFMANMSHELRTPLNSILLLSRLLMEDKEKTLTGKQAEFAHTVHSAGEDLLNLINEILDLAKVESGKMEIESAPVAVQSIARAMQGSFTPLAEQSGIAFSTHVAPEVPRQLVSDRKRIEQIVKNFLSNAFKFTPGGSIHLSFSTTSGPSAGSRSGSPDESGWLSISVADTGIGIPKGKQEMVFDAFQQADGSTRRKYGGTGLGLSISRELAHMLGGEITLVSEEGRGSCFTLHLPIPAPSSEAPGMIRGEAATAETDATSATTPVMEDTARAQGVERVSDDRNQLGPESACILIIGEDVKSIETILAAAQDHGYKAVVAEQRMTALHFADYYRPCAAFIDSHFSDSSAWPIVSQIKTSPKNISMPVFTFSDQAEHVSAAIHGAAGHILLPPARSRLAVVFRQIENWRRQRERTLLVVASNPQKAVDRTIASAGLHRIQCIRAASARAARKVLDSHAADATVWHPTMDPAEQRQFLTDWMANPIPILLYTGAAPNADYRSAIDSFTQLADLAPIHSPDQLLTRLLAYLHLPPEALDNSHRSRLDALISCQSPLKGRRVLLVDDDMRTVFAVTSALEDHGVEIYTGKTGKESLDKLDRFPDIDLILMDVMIAEADGYQAIREIRCRDRYQHVPILALTAKAMQGDRAKCIAAGADDYLAKPVNLDKLTSMLNVWLDPRLNEPHHIHD